MSTSSHLVCSVHTMVRRLRRRTTNFKGSTVEPFLFVDTQIKV